MSMRKNPPSTLLQALEDAMIKLSTPGLNNALLMMLSHKRDNFPVPCIHPKSSLQPCYSSTRTQPAPLWRPAGPRP